MPSISTTDSAISVAEAARTLFRTSTPSDEQILLVCRLMRSGHLQAQKLAGPPATWSTTALALAEYMASSTVHRSSMQRLKSADRDILPSSESANDGAEEQSALESASRGRSEKQWGHLAGIYREIWRDYFFAMLLRRQAQQRGAAFQRAVLIGQISLLVLIVALFVVAGLGVRSFRTPAGHAAILRHIDKSSDEFSVMRWHKPVPAPAGAGELFRVEYRYRKGSNRWIHTDRTFLLKGEMAVEMELE